MAEADKEIIKPERMKSYIWLQTSDGSVQQAEQEIAMFCPVICHEIHSGMGNSKNHPICLPQRVNAAMLSLILDYCGFHQVVGRSNKERKSFDEKFVRMDTKRLCELTSAADSLQLKPLVDLTSRALARMIEGKTPEEIRETFHLPDDLTEEEKLEPLKNYADDPRIRLLNRLYARKRKELKERDRLKNVEEEEECGDDRSLDDLLSFINGGNGESKGIKACKSKKKNRRRKDQQKNASSSCNDIPSIVSSSGNNVPSIASSSCNNIPSIASSNVTGILKKELNGLNSNFSEAKSCDYDLPDIAKMLKLQDYEDDRFALDDDDDDIYDEIDPALKEKIDREVEDFARRLNSDWPERMQELLSLGQERRPVPASMSSNGSWRR